MKNFFKLFYLQNGQSLIELLITIGISAIVIPALFGAVYASRAGRAQQDQRIQALTLARQGQEIAREIRDNDWSTFSKDGTYHPVAAGNNWALTSGSQTINGFTRQIVITDAYRDGNGNLTTAGVTSDPSVKYVTTTVSWLNPIPSSVVLSDYLVRLTSATYTQTTQADFNAGTNSGTAVVATVGTSIPDDGQVQLGAGGTGNWCNPNQTPIVSYDLPGQGVTTSISATYSASTVHVYTTTGYNASGDSMDSFSVSDPTPPPGTPVVSSNGAYNYRKTYGIFADTNNVFLTSNHPGLTVDVVNASSPYSEVATYNAGGTGTSVSVISGQTGFVTVGTTLYAFNASNMSGSLSTKGSKSLAGTGNKVVVVGSYAYVATSYVSGNNPKGQLQIINVSNPANMNIVSTVNVGNNLDGVDVFINQSGTYAYLVTKYASGKSDFYILDISNKSSPVIHGSYSTNGMTPTGVIGVSGNHAIVVGTGGSPYQVLSVSNVDNPTYCMPQGFSLSGVNNINAVAAVSEPDGDAYSYILTDNASAELQIIEGGPGGQFATSGTFTSSIFATNSAVFNRFDATTTNPAGTSISYQIAVANKVNNSCSGLPLVYVGPNGTSSPSDVFATGSALPVVINNGAGYANPGQCLGYKAYLSSTDTTLSPVLNDITFSYSP